MEKILFTPLDHASKIEESILQLHSSYWSDAWKRLRRNRIAMAGLITLSILFIMAIIGPWLTPYTYYETHLSLKNTPPCAAYWFGSDELGRDLFTRIWWGARISLFVGISASLIDLIVGVFYGALAGYSGGKRDEIMMRTADILYAIPYLLVVILLMVVIGPGLMTIILALAMTGWIGMARIVRGQILQMKNLDFVKAAHALGASHGRLLAYHLIPNAMGPIIVTLTITIPTAIFAEAFLSFLGLGVQAPIASWGTMANDGLGALRYYPWRLFFPAGFISLTMLSFNLLGDGLRDAFDPRLKAAPAHKPTIKLQRAATQPADPKALLSIRDLQISFEGDTHDVHAVRGLSFDLFEGETIAIVGESGCGKSVTAKALLSLLPQHRVDRAGEIWYQGKLLSGYSERQMRKVRGKEIGMIFQDPMTSLNPTMKIGQQIVEGYLRHHPEISKKEALDYAIEMLRLVGIPQPDARVSEYPHTLSGGMRQRVMIALALASKPKLLIADEPTTSLDVTIQAQILDLLKEIQKKTQTAILLITHDLSVVAGICDRVLVMYAGKIVESATVDELFAHPRHPYTQRLLQSIPRLDNMKEEPLHPIEGSPPDLSIVQKGCSFCPRCPEAMQICQMESPPLFEARSACWKHDPRAKVCSR